MSRPDFISKQIIFIESNNKNKIKFKNSNLVLIDENNKILLQNSLYKIFIVFIYGEFSITSVLIKKAKKHSIYFSFLNYNLKSYFSITSDNKGNFLLRKKQYTFTNNFELSKHIVKDKIKNQLYLMKSLRYKTPKEKSNIEKINYYINKINFIKDSNELLGIEGSSSKIYFKTYFKNLDFKGRKPRCKTDIFNLLLDIGYYYLFNFIDANLELYGFDNFYGFYHKLFFQRKSLVCDIIEPFRVIIDRRIKKSYNLKQIDNNNFYFKNGQYHIKQKYNKKYSNIFLKEILLYKEKIFLYIQRYYRSFMKNKDINNYPNFYLEEIK